jgi:DNA-binding response OmpR family regulator
VGSLDAGNEDASAAERFDPSVRAMLREYFEDHAFGVAEAGSGDQMRECIERELPDAVLLDIRLPGEDGLSLAKYLRERYDLGIIMVTASGDVIDRVIGLEVSGPTITSPNPSIRASCRRG